MEIGSAYKIEDDRTMEIKGRDLVTGLPKTIEISEEQIREALRELKREFDGVDESEAGERIRSWIEQ